MSDLSSAPDGKRIVCEEMGRIAGELTERIYLNNIQAVAVVFIDGDGDLSTRIAYQIGTKLPLLAGTTILHGAMLDEMRLMAAKPIDPEAKE